MEWSIVYIKKNYIILVENIYISNNLFFVLCNALQTGFGKIKYLLTLLSLMQYSLLIFKLLYFSLTVSLFGAKKKI